jgi:hypothetical protein
VQFVEVLHKDRAHVQIGKPHHEPAFPSKHAQVKKGNGVEAGVMKIIKKLVLN